MRKWVTAGLALAAAALMGAATAGATLIRIDFAGAITTAGPGGPFSGSLSFDDSAPELLPWEGGARYRFSGAAQFSLSFGNSSGTYPVSANVINDAFDPFCAGAPCDAWTLQTPTDTSFGTGAAAALIFGDLTSSQRSDASFFVPTTLADWDIAVLSLTVFNPTGFPGFPSLNFMGPIESWQVVVPEPRVESLALLAMCALGAIASRRARTQ